MAGLINTTDAPDYTKQVQDLYQSNFGREGDAEGVNYWTQQMKNGMTSDQLSTAFANSAKQTYQNYQANPTQYAGQAGQMLAGDALSGKMQANLAMPNPTLPASSTAGVAIEQQNELNKATGYLPQYDQTDLSPKMPDFSSLGAKGYADQSKYVDAGSYQRADNADPQRIADIQKALDYYQTSTPDNTSEAWLKRAAELQNASGINFFGQGLDESGKPIAGLEGVDAKLQTMRTQAIEKANALKLSEEARDAVAKGVKNISGAALQNFEGVSTSSNGTLIKYKQGMPVYAIKADGTVEKLNAGNLANYGLNDSKYFYNDASWNAHLDPRNIDKDNNRTDAAGKYADAVSEGTATPEMLAAAQKQLAEEHQAALNQASGALQGNTSGQSGGTTTNSNTGSTTVPPSTTTVPRITAPTITPTNPTTPTTPNAGGGLINAGGQPPATGAPNVPTLPTTPALPAYNAPDIVGNVRNALNSTQNPQLDTTTPDVVGGVQSALANTQSATQVGQPQVVTPTSWEVNPEQTVQGQIGKMLDPNSILNTQAQTFANQQMNARGLGNTSLAVSAAQDAMYKNALPIAQQDASIYAQSGQFNANAKNQMALANADTATKLQIQKIQSDTSLSLADKQALTQAALQKADSDVKMKLQKIQADTSLGLADKQAMTQAALQQADNDVKLRLQDVQSNTSMSLADKQSALQTALQQADNLSKLQIANIQANTTLSATDKQIASQQAMANADNALKAAIANLQADTTLSTQEKQLMSNQLIAKGDNDTKLLLQKMQDANIKLNTDTQLKIASLDNDTKKQLLELDAKYKSQLQSSSNAAGLFQQYITNLANIGSANMSESAKQAAMQNQLNNLYQGMQMVSQVSGLDLSKYFNPENVSFKTADMVNPSAGLINSKLNEGENFVP